MKPTEVHTWEMTDGLHKGHDVVTDAFAIDFLRHDPKTSFYCRTCKVGFKAEVIPETPVPKE